MMVIDLSGVQFGQVCAMVCTVQLLSYDVSCPITLSY